MAIDKPSAALAPHGSAHTLESRAGGKSAVPRQQIDLLALEIDDDDAGGDPYNRTGQFCLAELKKRDQ